jgi:hypothetical protein
MRDEDVNIGPQARACELLFVEINYQNEGFFAYLCKKRSDASGVLDHHPSRRHVSVVGKACVPRTLKPFLKEPLQHFLVLWVSVWDRVFEQRLSEGWKGWVTTRGAPGDIQ